MARADVSLKAKEAIVKFDPGQVTVSQMIEAIDHLGFRAALKDSPRSSTPPATR